LEITSSNLTTFAINFILAFLRVPPKI